MTVEFAQNRVASPVILLEEEVGGTFAATTLKISSALAFRNTKSRGVSLANIFSGRVHSMTLRSVHDTGGRDAFLDNEES